MFEHFLLVYDVFALSKKQSESAVTVLYEFFNGE